MRKNHVIRQLEQLGYTDNEELTYEELVNKLTKAKALKVDADEMTKGWF